MGLLSARVGEERGRAAKPRENLLFSHRLFAAPAVRNGICVVGGRHNRQLRTGREKRGILKKKKKG